MERKKSQEKIFPGFKKEYARGYFKYPMELENYWCQLSGSEQKVLDFILRQTLGFQKSQDVIAYSQIQNGVKGLNKGTGLSRVQVYRCVNSLEEKGFIDTVRVPRKPILMKLRISKNSKESETSSQPVSDLTPELARLIRSFAPVAGHHAEAFLENQKEVDAMKKMVDLYGVATIESLIRSLPKLTSEPYAPTVTSPTELEIKYPKLVAAFRRASARKPRDII